MINHDEGKSTFMRSMKYILGSIRVLLVLFNTALQVGILLVDGWINGVSIERRFMHRRRWARTSTWLLGIRLDEHTGTISDQPALIISNHRTLLDPVIQAAYLDAYIIAKASVSKLPMISQGARLTGIIFVKRDKLKSRHAARLKSEEVLKSGQNVLVYAEGTTYATQRTGKFKIGTFGIAADLNIPVIPITIEYPEAKDFWFEGSMARQIFGQVGAWRTRAKLRIGAPIKNTEAKVLLEQIQSHIDQNLLEMQDGWSEVFTKVIPENV